MVVKEHLVIDQGTTYTKTFNLIDENGDVRNLANCTVESQFRKWYTSTNASATFTTSINVDSGSITLSLTKEQTANLVPGRFVYDVKLIDSSNQASREYEGVVTVTPAATR